jgi:Zn-finger nucleic acid-binding protein
LPSGVRLATTPATPSSGICPRCDRPLFEADAQGVVLLGCGMCGGIWLDNTSAQRVVTTLDTQVVELANRASAHASATPERLPAGRCAVCQCIMGRTRVTRLLVEVDVCPEHGTWFDRGELATILSALRSQPRPRTAAPAVDTPLSPNEIPDFRAGTRSLDAVDAGLVVGGALTVLGALLGAART